MQISKILRLLLQYVKYTSGHVCSLRFFVDYVFRLTLSLADGAPRLIFVEENIQEYFKVSLRPLSWVHVQVVCMCDLWYGSIWVESYLLYYSNKVIMRFLFGRWQNVAKYGHDLNLVVWLTGAIQGSSFEIHKSHMPYFTLQ